MDTIKNIGVSGSVAAVVAALVLLITGVQGQPGQPGKDGFGALSSPEVYSYLNVHGAFSQGGGVTTATPVNSAYTLTNDDMVSSNVITFTASTTMPALTVTLPATTSFPLPAYAGAYRSWVIENPFTAAATTTTIAAGTGVDLQEPDGQNVVIGITNYAFLNCYRKASTDIVCSVDENIPAD